MIFYVLPLIILLSLRPLSFAKYNWKKKQYLQAVGMVLLVVAMLIIPVYVMVSR